MELTAHTQRRAQLLALGLTLLGVLGAGAMGRHALGLVGRHRSDLLDCAISLALTLVLCWVVLLMGFTLRELSVPGRHTARQGIRQRCTRRMAGLLLTLAASGAYTASSHSGSAAAVTASASVSAGDRLPSPDLLDPSVAPGPGATTKPEPAGTTHTPGTAGPASTNEAAPRPDLIDTAPTDGQDASPSWTPQRPPAARGVDGRLMTEPSRGSAAQVEVAVRRGDTLWPIAARQLGPNADARTIADAVGRWHQANRSVIGPDADRLFAGQILHAPKEA